MSEYYLCNYLWTKASRQARIDLWLIEMLTTDSLRMNIYNETGVIIE